MKSCSSKAPITASPLSSGFGPPAKTAIATTSAPVASTASAAPTSSVWNATKISEAYTR